MRKQEVKSLQDRFTKLFETKNQRHREADKNSIFLNGLEQQAQYSDSGTFKQLHYPQSQHEQAILYRIDEVANPRQESQNQIGCRELMLNCKINQLKIQCSSLVNANIILRQKLFQLQKSKPEMTSQNTLENSSDLTVLQQNFVNIQEELSTYKHQLSSYRQMMSQKMTQKDHEINCIRRQLNYYKHLSISIEALQRQLSKNNRTILLLERDNRQLTNQIQQLTLQSNVRGVGRHNSYFDEKICNQMESLIEKLVKQLKLEKKTSSKQIAEIKRLNSELIQMEGALKAKNKQIYDLEFSLIKRHKNQQQKKGQPVDCRQKEKAFQKFDHSYSPSGSHQDDLRPYVPQHSLERNNLMSPKRLELLNINRSIQSERSYDKPIQSERSYDKPIQSERSYDKPIQSERSYDKPIQSERSYDKPIQSERSYDKPIQSERSYDKHQISTERWGFKSGGLNSVLRRSWSFTLMDLLSKEFRVRQAQKQVIASRIIELYSDKILKENYDSLIPEQIQICNFSSRDLSKIKVHAAPMPIRGDSQRSESQLLYNMSFILDALLRQVEVVDASAQNCLELGLNDYIWQIQMKSSKEEKYRFLQQLSHNIDSRSTNF